MSKLHLSKFDVAERQLLLAIRLFFQEEDSVAIHTLSEASSQILFDLKKDHGIQSMFRESDLIKDEHKKEWRKHLSKSKNFFKHADNDPKKIHEFNSVINHFSLIDSVNMYETIKKKWVPETLTYTVWFSSTYPNLLKKGSNFEAIYKKTIEYSEGNPTLNKSVMNDLLKKIKDEEITFPNATATFS